MKMKSKMGSSRVKTAMVVASSLAVSANIASATVIGVNFTGSGYGAVGQDVTADAYGVAVADWINVAPGVGGSPGGGTFTLTGGITGSWTANNDWAQTSGFSGTPGNDEVNYAYADDTGDNLTITLSGLGAWLTAEGATEYFVQIIQATDNGEGFTNTDLFDSDGGTALGTLVNPTVGTGGNVGGATSFSAGLTSDTLFIDPQIRAVAIRGTVAGIIISTIPEPSTMVLLGLGGVALVLRRRR